MIILFHRKYNELVTFNIKKSLITALVIPAEMKKIRGIAANHVKMKLNGSGNWITRKKLKAGLRKKKQRQR